jgi:glycosidase
VKEARQKKIRVILDIVLNHSGDVFAYKSGSMRWNKEGDTGQVFDVDCFRGPQEDSRVTFETQAKDADLDTAVWPIELQNPCAFTRKGAISNYDYYPEFFEGDFDVYKDIDIGPYNTENFSPTDALNTLCSICKYWMAYANIHGFRIDTEAHGPRSNSLLRFRRPRICQKHRQEQPPLCRRSDRWSNQSLSNCLANWPRCHSGNWSNSEHWLR